MNGAFKNQTRLQKHQTNQREFCNDENVLFIKKIPQSPNNIADKYVKQNALKMQTGFNK